MTGVSPGPLGICGRMEGRKYRMTGLQEERCHVWICVSRDRG